MRIETGSVALASQFSSRKAMEVQESARVWGDLQKAPKSLPIRLNIPRLPTEPSPVVDDSIERRGPGRLPANAMEAFQRALELAPPPPKPMVPSAPPPPKSVSEEEPVEGASIEQNVTAMILKRMFGVEAEGASEIEEAMAEGAKDAARSQEQMAEAQKGPDQRHGWGVEYRRHERRIEQEQVAFAAEGQVTTEDGRAIAFSTAYAREYTSIQESEFVFRAGDPPPKDPLVVDAAPGGATLTDQTFAFDLDGDGALDDMPGITGGAYLAIDRNGDGAVNDGTELFGPQSGDGFADLAALDSDGNQWIDENDTAWTQMGVWSGGSSSLTSLNDAGIGAFYLGSVATPFTERGASSVLGFSRASGAYLSESGLASTYRQIDVVA